MQTQFLEKFRTEHARLEAGLAAAQKALPDTAALLLQLKAMRAEVLSHFKAKDAFYPR